jgi:hypothetical protein
MRQIMVLKRRLQDQERAKLLLQTSVTGITMKNRASVAYCEAFYTPFFVDLYMKADLSGLQGLFFH